MSAVRIFVFGSNLAGRHGAGAAKFAMQNHGAEYGVGEGLTGQSYALPTKDAKIKTLPLYKIQMYVRRFTEFARSRPDLLFDVTAVGCGLAGYKPEQIAPFFFYARTLPNICLPKEFALETTSSYDDETRAAIFERRRRADVVIAKLDPLIDDYGRMCEACGVQDHDADAGVAKGRLMAELRRALDLLLIESELPE